MRVRFVDLGAEYRELRGEIDQAIRQVVAHSQFIGGPPVEAFESEFARFLGVEHCVGVSSGTEALRLGLEALGVGPGDEVLVPANTFAATALAVAARGATPRFVDCDERTLLMDPARVAPALTPRTRAIVPVHLYGRVLDVAPLRGFGVPILEDAAQAHGAHHRGWRPEPRASWRASASIHPRTWEPMEMRERS